MTDNNTPTTPANSDMPEALRQNPKRQEAAPAKTQTKPKGQPMKQTVVIQTMPDGTKRKVIRRVVKKKPTVKKPLFNVKKVLLWFFGLMLFGVIIFYALLMWGLMTESLENPLFIALGMTSKSLQSTLVMMTNVVFGLLALTLLIITLINFFRYATAPKDNPRKKRSLLTRGILFLLGFFMMGGLWIGLFVMISSAQVKEEAPELQSYILTDPVSVTGLTAPITVKFDIGTKLFSQISQNNITEITWDFDGDGIVDARGPEVSYRFLELGENNGRYPTNVVVKYRVNPLDPSSEEKEFKTSREVIIANEAIVAEIVASPEAGYAPLEVELSAAKSFDPDGAIVYYEWDLNNDGEYEKKGQLMDTVTKTWAQTGKYTVNLRVTGQNGDFALTSQEINVIAQDQNLSAEVSAITPLEGFAPLKVIFDGSQSYARVGKIVKYEWFTTGEEGSFTGRKFEKIFRMPGEYEVRMVIESDAGEKTEAKQIVTVWEEDNEVELDVKTTPTKNKEGQVTGVAPLEVVFNANESQIKNPVEWTWDFENDGIIDKYAPAVKHTYYEPGEYDAVMTVYDANNRPYEIVQKVIVRNAGLVAKINADPTNGSVPLKVNFDASGSINETGNEIINYIWTLPGREPLNYGAQIDYEFLEVGLYPVTLQVMTESGQTAEAETFVTVRDTPLTAEFTALPTDGVAPMKVKFDPGKSTGTIAEYEWNFGDNGNTSSDVSPEYTYQKAGNYEVTLTITDNRGIISQSKQYVKVRAKN